MHWRESWRADPAARRIADGHYSRQTIGADQFVQPGRCVVLVIPEVAYWVTSWPFPEYVKHAWPTAWTCSAFRNTRPDLHLSSDLILEAIAATRFYWTPPPDGMITFVDASKVRHKRDPGRCFRKAGFHISGTQPGCTCDGKPRATTTEGHLAFHLSVAEMPPARQPLGAQTSLAL